MKDIFSEYAKDKNKDKNKLDFKYKDKSIDDNQTLKDFLQNNIDKINEEEENKTTVDINISKMKDKEPTININIIDLPCFSYFFKVYKIPFFIVLGLIVLAGITLLLIFLLRNDSDDKSSSQKIPIIPTDYFIKAIYTSDQSETVNLISNSYNLNKIKNMSIDGDISRPLRSFTFPQRGEHTIYFSFNNLNKNSLSSEGRGIFSGIQNLINVEFSNYSDNLPDVSFNGMFNNCINLETVDFSKIQLDYDIYYEFNNQDIYDYYNTMDFMFNNCTNLKSVNFDFTTNENLNNIIIISSQFMFNNCISLTIIILSKLQFYFSNMNNMFSNCISLDTIRFNNFRFYDGYINISHMYYNCSLLVSLYFPTQYMNNPNDMSYSFAYCNSFTKLELVFDLNYTHIDSLKKKVRFLMLLEIVLR